MAFDPTPTNVFASWSEDGTDITVPIASFPELTAEEADASTGDSRKIIFAIMEVIWAWFAALAGADRPSQLTVSKSSSINTVTNVMTSTYQIVIKTDVLTQEVVDEA